MIQANNSKRDRAEKIHAIISYRNAWVHRVDVISSIAWDTPPCFPPFFWNVTKMRSECAIDGRGRKRDERERLMRATRERTNGRRAVRDFRTLAYTHICTEQREYRALTAIWAPRVLLSLRQLPTPLLPSRVCTCVPAIWNCTHLHAHEWADELVNERASERASKLLTWDTRGTSISVSSTYFYNLRQYGDR